MNRGFNVLKGIIWSVVALIAAIGIIVWFIILSVEDLSAPQLAAQMATLIAFVVIPYVFARAISEIGNRAK